MHKIDLIDLNAMAKHLIDEKISTFSERLDVGTPA
jgi:hypothetical protein